MASTKSDYAYYPKLWQKSYLIEIVRKDNGVLHRAYAFSLPPEAVKIQIPQRVNVRKTFGGLFVDDYGVDSMSITLSGSTGNGQMKEIYWDGATRFADGKNEAALIVSEILHYKYRLSDYDQYEMRLWDLSSVSDAVVNHVSTLKNLSPSAWRVVLKDGSIDQSKDKPFFFSYSMEFIAIEPIGVKRYTLKKARTQSYFEQVLAAIEKVKTASGNIKKALASYREVLDTIRKVEEITDSLEAEILTYYRLSQGFVDATVDSTNSFFNVIAFPLNLAGDLLIATRDVRSSVEDGWQEIINGYPDWWTKAENIAELFRRVFSLEESASEIIVNAKGQGRLPEIMLVASGTAGSVPAINATDPSQELPFALLATYGYYERVATSETRLDALSVQVYGSPDYADVIAKFNGITGDSDISPGMEIKLPYLSYTIAIQESEVYGPETYGTDIALASDGDLRLAEYNDYMTITGISNMEQAIELRLSEDQGTRIRLTAYGLKQAHGTFDAFSIAVLIASIRDTLVQDSRIKTAFGFSIQQDRDDLRMSFTVELVSGGTAQYSVSL